MQRPSRVNNLTLQLDKYGWKRRDGKQTFEATTELGHWSTSEELSLLSTYQNRIVKKHKVDTFKSKIRIVPTDRHGSKINRR